MKKFLTWAMVLVCSTALAKPVQPRIVSVLFDTDLWNQNMLLKALNDNGQSKNLKFTAAALGGPFDYKIAYDNSIKPVQSAYGEMALHATSVTCFDPAGQVLFTFTREARWTEKGATNAASEEIIKRLLALGKMTAVSSDKLKP